MTITNFSNILRMNQLTGINYDLFKDYFKFEVPTALAKKKLDKR